ncbi:MAG: hypothetical protein AAFZ80_11185 [Cyanobacteria bacterium P01_A01_bin.105]
MEWAFYTETTETFQSIGHSDHRGIPPQPTVRQTASSNTVNSDPIETIGFRGKPFNLLV